MSPLTRRLARRTAIGYLGLTLIGACAPSPSPQPTHGLGGACAATINADQSISYSHGCIVTPEARP